MPYGWLIVYDDPTSGNHPHQDRRSRDRSQSGQHAVRVNLNEVTWDWNDPLRYDGYTVLRDAMSTAAIERAYHGRPGHGDGLAQANFNSERGLPSRPTGLAEAEHDSRRMETSDKSGTSRWIHALKPELTQALHRTGHLGPLTGDRSLQQVHGLRSLAIPTYNLDIETPQDGDQHAHTDEDPAKYAEWVRKHPHAPPLSFVLALQDGTRLRLRTHAGVWHTVHLQAGDILLFDGSVWHYGLGYPTDNDRVHGYLWPAGYHAGPRGVTFCHDAPS